jgi:hypothetical protein
MKGIELLSTLVALLMLLGISSILGGLVIYVINAVRQPTTSPIDYEMYLSPGYPPIKYQTMLLSYLESTEASSGLQFKKIMIYAALQRNVTDIFVDGYYIDTLGDATQTSFNKWIPEEFYLLALNVKGTNLIITKNDRALRALSSNVIKLRRVSVPVYIDASMIGAKPKNSDIPINVTLDLYVR